MNYFSVLFFVWLWQCCIRLWVMRTIAAQLSNKCSTSKRGETINGISDKISIMFTQWLFCPLGFAVVRETEIMHPTLMNCVFIRRIYTNSLCFTEYTRTIYALQNIHKQFMLYRIYTYVQFFPSALWNKMWNSNSEIPENGLCSWGNLFLFGIR
jgi:hypothetical protein